MLVREWMTRNVLTLGVSSTLIDAAEILHRKSIRQFPVIDSEGKVVGIVSDRDVRDAMPSKFLPGDGNSLSGGDLSTLTAGDIMTLDPYTVESTTCMDTVAEMIVRNKIGGLPVVDDGELVGIITQADVMRFLCSATGAVRGGAQLAFRLEARPGPLAELLNSLRDMGVHFTSVFTSYDVEKARYRNAYIRVAEMGDKSVEEVIDALSERFEVLYYVNEGITVDCM